MKNIRLSDFKPLEFRGFRYWKGTRNLFGFWAALTQLSPPVNMLRHKIIS